MESNINYTQITAYSQRFSAKICDKYFENKNSINGEGILLISPVQQINLFIIWELLNLWKIEIENLKSPYFDYGSEEVQNQLKKFMNVLSKNIKMERKHLEPLLVQATERAVLLIFSPYQFYKNVINNAPNSKVSISFLLELSKYVKINKHLLESYIKKLEDNKIEEVFSEEALTIFDEVCENISETPEDFEIYITMFNEVLLLDITAFYEVDSGQSKPAAQKETERDEHEDAKSINETLYEDVETLADAHEKQGIEGIKKNITINQRFMFVNELFRGDTEEFESVVNFLDNCKNKKEALDFIELNYVKGKDWDVESEEYEEFIHIINRRFPS